MKTFFKRLTSTVILLALFAFMLAGPAPYSNWVFGALAIFFSYFAVYEFGKILTDSNHLFPKKTTAIFTAVTVLASLVFPFSIGIIILIFLVYVIHGWTRFLVSKNEEFRMQAIFSSVSAYFLFTIPFCSAVVAYQLGGKLHIIFLYLVIVTKIGDIAAYVVGSLSNYFLRNSGGNHKMIPSISPGKSYEGAVGGFVFTLLFSWILWRFIGLESCLGGLITPLLLGFFMFFGCMAGDLSESAFKRTCKIKDSGTILPGIGGILDLVDSLMVTAPLFIVFLYVCTNAFEQVSFS